MNINYVISLGKQCHTAEFLKDNKLKNCSYPFDWIFSWHQMKKAEIKRSGASRYVQCTAFLYHV